MFNNPTTIYAIPSLTYTYTELRYDYELSGFEILFLNYMKNKTKLLPVKQSCKEDCNI